MPSDDSAAIGDPSIAEFILLASHGLRSPITAIRWGLEMLQNSNVGNLNDIQQDIIYEVHRNSREMSAILRSMILLSRIEQGKYTLEPSKVPLKSILNDVDKEYTSWAVNRKLRYNMECKADLTVEADASLLLSIILHLYAACIESCFEGGDLGVVAEQEGNVAKVCFTGEFPLPRISHLGQRDAQDRQIIGGTPGLLLYLAHALSGSMGWQLQTEENNDGHVTSITLLSPPCNAS